MRTLAVLPVKSFASAKGRLSDRLDPGARARLAEAMLGDVLEALRGARSLDGIAVVTAEPGAVAAAAAARAEVLPDPGEAGQSAAALVGVDRAARGGYERVLLVPGDTPLLAAADVDALLARSAGPPPCVTIFPDRHGTGTNALAVAPPSAFEASFGPGSLARHLGAARVTGLAHAVERVPALELDVDTPEDLAELALRLDAANGAAAPRTRTVLAALSVPAEV
jgi:2-phospho-L-lactate/phosphoenolpyruvate guanylyltransferase